MEDDEGKVVGPAAERDIRLNSKSTKAVIRGRVDWDRTWEFKTKPGSDRNNQAIKIRRRRK